MTFARNGVMALAVPGYGSGAQVVTVPAAVPAADEREIARLITRFRGFAGSDANARALIAGLRYGCAIALHEGRSEIPVRFTPETGSMGFSSVNVSLLLAMHALAAIGIESPSPQQIRAALNGGVARTREDGATELLPGVLKLRSEGHGWGEIATTVGSKLGKHDDGNAGSGRDRMPFARQQSRIEEAR